MESWWDAYFDYETAGFAEPGKLELRGVVLRKQLTAGFGAGDTCGAMAIDMETLLWEATDDDVVVNQGKLVLRFRGC